MSIRQQTDTVQSDTAGSAAQTTVVDFYVMGKRYEVPQELTIQTALEYCGYRLVRGCGCRIGHCGACATVYNFSHDRTLRYGLACQTRVAAGMCIVQLPFFPNHAAVYALDALNPTPDDLIRLYPEVLTCFGCNNCTRSCPQELPVLDYVSAALRGDLQAVADMSFDCVMCGMCAARCPQGIAPQNVALLARRIVGKHLSPKAAHLDKRVKEIEAGKFDSEYEELVGLPYERLRQLYDERWIEPK